MSQQLSDIERQLTSCYTAQAQYYARALEVAQSISQRFETGTSAADEMTRLNEHLAAVAELDSAYQTVKKSWDSANVRAGEELRAALQHVQQLLEKLIPLIGVAERAAKHAKERLTPQLNAQSKSARVRDAYAAAATACNS